MDKYDLMPIDQIRGLLMEECGLSVDELRTFSDNEMRALLRWEMSLTEEQLIKNISYLQSEINKEERLVIWNDIETH